MGRNRSSAHTKAQRNGRERDYNRCQVCGSKKHVEGHHIIDHQFGGAANIDNIVAFRDIFSAILQSHFRNSPVRK